MFALALGACTPKAGDTCKGGESRCADPASALACVDSVYAAIPCRGARGCGVADGGPRCDDTVAGEGDACLIEGDMACSVDARSLMACRAGHFARESACRGPKACAAQGEGVTCDVGIAEPNEHCMREDNYACSVDRAAMLVCRGGVFQIALRCRGARGCNLDTGQVDCDDASAELGDACDADGDVACSRDGKSMLTCKAHAFGVGRTCKSRCVVESGAIACDR